MVSTAARNGSDDQQIYHCPGFVLISCLKAQSNKAKVWADIVFSRLNHIGILPKSCYPPHSQSVPLQIVLKKVLGSRT